VRARELDRPGGGDAPLDWSEGMLVGPNPGDGVFHGNRFVHHDYGYTLRVPPGWERLHSRRAVGAVAPDGRAQVVLEYQGPSASPDEAGEAFLAELAARMAIEVESRKSLRVSGSPAYRAIAFAETPAGRVRLELHWFTLATGVFRLVGASAIANTEAAQVAMRNVARSLQALSDRERAQIQELRLLFVTSAANERLAELSRRVGNVWSLEQTAAINRVGPEEALPAGTRVKVAIRAPFRGRDLGANRMRR